MDRANDMSPGERDPEDVIDTMREKHKRRGKTFFIFIGVFLLLFGWFTRPLWHDFIFGIWKYGEVLNVFLLTAVVMGVIYYRSSNVFKAIKTGGIVLLIGWVVFMSIGNLVTQDTLASELQFTERDDIAKIDSENPRILPQQVSDRFAQNTLQFPRHRLGNADITMINGSPHWSYALAPEGGLNRFVLDQKGASFVDMTNSSRNLYTIEQNVSPGQGMALWNNYLWQLRKDKYWAEHTDPFMVPHDGELYLATPYIEYSLRFLPILHTVPEWGGVSLVNPDGSVEHLSPEEAQNSDVLSGQRLYPFSLAYTETNSMRFSNGIINFLFFHEDQLEIASVTKHENGQPFFVPTKEGLQYFLAVEPYGDAAGIFQVWHFDARKGEKQVYRIGEDDAMLGPNRAADYVRRASPMVDWDRLRPAEPLPVVVNDTLYWKLRVIPNDGSGISYTAFVNAKTTNVLAFENDKDIRRFMRGEIDAEQRMVDEENTSSEDSERVDVREGDIHLTIFEDGELISNHSIEGNATIEIQR